MRILVIDDCLINRKLLAGFFRPYGQCDCADNGGLGLDLFFKASRSPDPYSLICLDISMPGMNGYEALDAIRKFEESRGVPAELRVKVIIITAFADEECLLKTYDKCQGYIIKPIRIPKLAEKLATLGMTPGSHQEERRQEAFAEYMNSVPCISFHDGRFAVFTPKAGQGVAEELNQHELEYFKNVVMGQLVAMIDPSAKSLSIGQGLYIGPDRCSVFASENGRVSIVKGELRLDETIRFEHGLRESVDFVGKVEVEGDVADGVSLRATKGIVIRGDAGACELKTEGDIEMLRFNGKGQGLAKCGGSFTCDFLYGAKVETRGSANIKREALNAEIKAADSLYAGTLSGCSCVALNRIDIGRAGSANDPGTNIRGGLNFHLLDRKNALEMRLRDNETKIVKVRQMLGPYADDVGLAVMLYEDKRGKIYDYSEELNRLESMRNELKREYDEVMAMPHAKADPVIEIREILHKGVKLSIGDRENIVAEDIKGPFTVSEMFIKL